MKVNADSEDRDGLVVRATGTEELELDSTSPVYTWDRS
jgi:hypothetical protein